MLQGGLDRYWRNRNYPAVSVREKCRDLQQSKVLRNLGLYDLQSSFLVLAVGMGLAIIAFLLEAIVYNVTRSAHEHIWFFSNVD